MFYPDIKMKTWHIIDENCVELRFSENEEHCIESEFISEITAVFTTANARCRLYSMLDRLHPSQIIYCDTDSVIFIYDPDNPLHKCPSNETPGRPNNVSFGDGLGQWENEFKKGELLTEVVISGAKSYSYKKEYPNEKTDKVVKQKGITIDKNNSK